MPRIELDTWTYPCCRKTPYRLDQSRQASIFMECQLLPLNRTPAPRLATSETCENTRFEDWLAQTPFSQPRMSTHSLAMKKLWFSATPLLAPWMPRCLKRMPYAPSNSNPASSGSETMYRLPPASSLVLPRKVTWSFGSWDVDPESRSPNTVATGV